MYKTRCLMDPLNNYIIFDRTNNTKRGKFSDYGYKKGISEMERLIRPNQGTVISGPKGYSPGDIIHYRDVGIKKVENSFVVDASNVFLKNGYLTGPGIIVDKHRITQKVRSFTLREQAFFRVIDMSPDGQIATGSLIIAIPYTSYRFNYEKQELFWLPADSVAIIMDPFDQKIKAGPGFGLYEKISASGFSKKGKENSGTRNGETYCFLEFVFEITISSKRYMVVRDSAVYAKKRSNRSVS